MPLTSRRVTLSARTKFAEAGVSQVLLAGEGEPLGQRSSIRPSLSRCRIRRRASQVASFFQQVSAATLASSTTETGPAGRWDMTRVHIQYPSNFDHEVGKPVGAARSADTPQRGRDVSS